ncbi:MAG: PD-(D/E)XK nuclease family protein [Phycisphaeraceae bacterium]|nr:PD-(D/E)XK nuclease family protein [Phycisphaeraceae bacterium]
MIERIFMGWERPLVESAAAWLASRFATNASGKGIDFQRALVVVPGRRFGRELVAEMVGIGEKTDAWVSPGRVITPGELSALLLDGGAERASALLRAMAWGEALRRLPTADFGAILKRRPSDESAGEWLRLGAMVDFSVGELGRELLTPKEVAERADAMQDSGEGPRWRSIGAAQSTYEDLLVGAGVRDGYAARLELLRSGAPVPAEGYSEIVLIGVVELDRASREALARSGLQVCALVFAPEDEAGGLDEYGCVLSGMRERVAIDARHVEFAEDLRDGARRVVGRIAAWTGEAHDVSARDVTVCAPEPAIAKELALAAAGVDGLAFHDAAGEEIGRASVVKLVSALAEFVREQTIESFAKLVKRPEVERWIEATVKPGGGWIDRIDHAAITLPGEFVNQYEGGDGDAVKAVAELCRELMTPGSGLSARLDALLAVLESVYEGVELSEREAGAMGAIAGVVAECRGCAAWTKSIEGWRAIELVLEALADARQAETSRRGEVEVLGWLESAVDRAPYLAVLGLNEGMIPTGRVEDALLPESVRRVLGLATGETRAERDAFLLEGLIRSREKRGGGVWFVCAKRDEEGNPLRTSRLLFRCDDDEALARVERMVEELPEKPRFEAERRVAEAGSVRDATSFPLAPIQEMEPPVEVRVTAFREYLRSPYMFFLKRVARLKELDEPSPEADQSEMGTFLHAVLSEFGPKESEALQREDDIAAWAIDRFASLASAGHRQRRSAVRDIQAEVAKRRLRTFARVQAEHAAEGWRVHSTEREPDKPIMMEVPEGKIGLTGRLDRIDVRGDEWLVLDYKTADKAKTPAYTHQKGDEWHDLQLPLYVFLLRAMEPKAKLVKTGYFLLPKASAEGTIEYAEWDEAAVLDGIERAREVVGAILQKEYPLGDDPFETGAFARLCGVSLIEVETEEGEE